MDSIKSLFFYFSIFLHILSGAYSAKFTILNKCSYTVWPGILSSAGTAPLSTTGFVLLPGASNILTVPTSWSGRLWGRTFCSTNSTGKFSCATADCGSGVVECNNSGAIPPATLAEFTLNGGGGFDFYDVSLVDGYNIAMQIVPQNGKAGNCTVTGCIADLNGNCPAELRVVSDGGGGEVAVACKSGCVEFGKPEYCCNGEYGNPNTCKPTTYSEYFKKNCPLAYSYAFDDGTSTFTCAAADYLISFCPQSLSLKASSQPYPEAAHVAGSRRQTTAPPFPHIIATISAAVWLLRSQRCQNYFI